MKHDYEAHADWQGKKYMLEGSSEEYPNFYETTGYGEMLGLAGINCRHHISPTWTWEKVEDLIDKEENAKVYEQQQKQREYERKIRFLKRERLIAKNQGYNELLEKNKQKFKEVNEKYNDFLEENGLTRDYSREYVNGSYTNENISSIYDNSVNREQYERYKDVLGENAPDTFDKFLEVKYNNSNEWNSLKADYSDAKGIYTEGQANMYINLVKNKFREGQQGKHILGHLNYIDGNSYVTISSEHIQELVSKYATTGEKLFAKKRKYGENQKRLLLMK